MDTKKTYRELSTILERDRATASYKFALLRGTIEVVLERSPFIKIEKERVAIPGWLIVEKWLIYYYPIFADHTFIPQASADKNPDKPIKFRLLFIPIVDYYEANGGYEAFYSDLRSRSIPAPIHDQFLSLADYTFDRIYKMPMKHFGKSAKNKFYSIFKYDEIRKRNIKSWIDSLSMLHRYPEFYIPLSYYELFEVMGAYILGTGSIIQRWAEFTANLARGKSDVTVSKMLDILSTSPVEAREVRLSQDLFANMLKNQGELRCVWSDKRIVAKSSLNLDHVVPFSVWKNNDLWNLLPASKTVNSKKSDKVPSGNRLEASREVIFQYWTFLYKSEPEIFMREVKKSLLGNYGGTDWQHISFEQLKKSCQHLIDERGFEPWNG
jgi:hypothetical protein